MGPCPLEPKEIDGLLVLLGKASLLTGHQITGKLVSSEPAPGKVVSSQIIHTYNPYWLIFEALFGCHDIIILW